MLCPWNQLGQNFYNTYSLLSSAGALLLCGFVGSHRYVLCKACWSLAVCFFLGRLVHAVQFSKDAVHHHFVADSGDLLAICICTVDNVDALRIVSR